jgi:endoglucanase
MNELIKRERVKGLLSVEGRKLVNGEGEEIILSGVGFGNWLLPEGYMWAFRGPYDRPHRIEYLIRHLTGTEYANNFWKQFKDAYTTKRDIELIAEMGFNSVRIPFNWRVLMKDEPGVEFEEDGFKLIDRCLDWCEEFNIYVVLDLHGAPGGQTGSNIDDCIDDIPRLFIDSESREKAIVLWEEIARRYKDRDIVAAYDLLNEPLRTSLPNKPDTEYLHPELVRFYDDCVAAIRRIDDRHAISIEGANWSSRTDTFYKSYDEKMIIHFHRYGNLPGEESYTEWIELSERMNAPIWLGESGENKDEWCTAMYPLGVKLGIGFNFWPWKKLTGLNSSPLEIKRPEDWDKITSFVSGGPRPSYKEAQEIFDEYLNNIKADNCHRNDNIVNSVLRRAPVTVMGTDFDTGEDCCSGKRPKGNLYRYRSKTGMHIKPRRGMVYSRGQHGFDSGWEKLCLELNAGEWAIYSVNDISRGVTVSVEAEADGAASMRVTLDADDAKENIVSFAGGKETITAQKIECSGDCRFKIECISGSIDIHSIKFSELD